MSLKQIDWSAREDSNEIRRPFSIKLEETMARDFIAAVKKNKLFVRETMVKLIREFVKEYGDPKEQLKEKVGE